MARVAITGATGFIGGHVVSHLVARGDEVRAVVRSLRASRGPLALSLGPRVTVVHARLEARALEQMCRGAETIVHLAGVVSSTREADFDEVNVEGTRTVARVARAIGARLVHISSLAAAGPAPASAPRSEDDPPAPITAYGRSKLESERVVASVDGLRWIILRPGVVYGPGDHALVPLFRFASSRLLPLVGRANAAYTFVHVSDLARAIAAAVDSAIDGDTIFVGHPRPVSARDLLEAVRAAAGRRAMIVRIPSSVQRLAALAGDLGGALLRKPFPINSRRYAEMQAEGFVCRVDRLREYLGIVATIELREGLVETAKWYRENDWI